MSEVSGRKGNPVFQLQWMRGVAYLCVRVVHRPRGNHLSEVQGKRDGSELTEHNERPAGKPGGRTFWP